jgi:hypothetical protein
MPCPYLRTSLSCNSSTLDMSWTSIILPSLVALVCLQYGLFRGEGRGLRLDVPGREAQGFELAMPQEEADGHEDGSDDSDDHPSHEGHCNH